MHPVLAEKRRVHHPAVTQVGSNPFLAARRPISATFMSTLTGVVASSAQLTRLASASVLSFAPAHVVPARAASFVLGDIHDADNIILHVLSDRHLVRE